MRDEATEKDLENLRLRLRMLSGMHKLDAIEHADEWDADEEGEALGRSIAYGKAADHLAEVLEGGYERTNVQDLIDDMPEEWSLNLLRYAAHTERGENQEVEPEP